MVESLREWASPIDQKRERNCCIGLKIVRIEILSTQSLSSAKTPRLGDWMVIGAQQEDESIPPSKRFCCGINVVEMGKTEALPGGAPQFQFGVHLKCDARM